MRAQLIIVLLIASATAVAQMSPEEAMKQLEHQKQADRPTYDQLAAEVAELNAERIKLKAKVRSLETEVATLSRERDALIAKYEPATVAGDAAFNSVEDLIAAFDDAVGLRPGANKIAQAKANEWLAAQGGKSIKATLVFKKVSSTRDGFVVSTDMLLDASKKIRYGFLVRLPTDRAESMANAKAGEKIEVAGKIERVSVHASGSSLTFSGAINDAVAAPALKR